VLVGIAAVIGMVWLGGLGLGIVEKEIAADLAGNPVIQRELGDIEEVDVDFSATMSTGGEDTVVLDVRGTKGSGVLTVESVTTEDDKEHVVAGKLEMNGKTHDLFPLGDVPDNQYLE
jgi:hypothetical protein